MNVDKRLTAVRAAIAKLAAAATHDEDAARAHVAAWLAESFTSVTDAASLRSTARDALQLYRGGMGSFQDVGTAVMGEAVNELRGALHDCVDTFPWLRGTFSGR